MILCYTYIYIYKVYRKADTLDDADNIQEDLDSLHGWTVEWRMFYTAKKFHVMHLGKNNLHSLYHLNGTLKTPVSQEMGLGVTVCDTL